MSHVSAEISRLDRHGLVLSNSLTRFHHPALGGNVSKGGSAFVPFGLQMLKNCRNDFIITSLLQSTGGYWLTRIFVDIGF